MKRFPVTIALTITMWAGYAVCALAGLHPREALGYNLPADAHMWHFLTAGLTAAHPWTLVVFTVGAAMFALPAEHVLGSRRFAAAAAAAQGVVMPAACILGAAVERAGFNLWGPDLVNEVYLSPAAWVFGPAAFATAMMNVLWRRRLRLLMVALSATLVLYAGTLSAVAALTAVLVGWFAGVLAVGFTRPNRRVSLRESRVLVAALFTSVCVGPVVTALNPGAQGPFAGVSALMWEPAVAAREVAQACVDPASTACRQAVAVNQQHGVGPLLLNLVPLALALVLAFGLVRGRRLAWGAAVVFSAASIAVIAWQALFDAPSVSPNLAINTVLIVLPWTVALVVLGWNRRRFTVASSWRPGLRPLIAAFVATAAAWIGGAFVLRDGFMAEPTVAAVLAELVYRYAPPAVSVQLAHHVFPQSAAAWALYEWVGIVFWAVALWAAVRVLTSAPSAAHERDRERARRIFHSGTGDHLAAMGLWDANSYFFTEVSGGEGYVAYRVAQGVAVTVGGPVHAGPVSCDAVAEAFEQFAATQGWRVAWYSVDDSFQRPGFKRIHVAEESVLSAQNVEFRGKKFQNIRTARNRAEKEGVQAVWTSWAEADLDVREKIAALSEDWVADKALPEMGFTLGTVEELRDPDTKLLLAVGDDGRLHGVTSWLPVYEDGTLVGYTLDFMRRDADGFRPVIEFLLAEAAVKASEQGLSWVSLSGAPLARSDEATDFLEILLDKAGATIEPLYGFRSLAASKYKFHPEHRGWYLAYDDELALPAIGLAVVHCYLPDMKAADAAAVVREFLGRRNAPTPEQPVSGTTPRP